MTLGEWYMSEVSAGNDSEVIEHVTWSAPS